METCFYFPSIRNLLLFPLPTSSYPIFVPVLATSSGEWSSPVAQSSSPLLLSPTPSSQSSIPATAQRLPLTRTPKTFLLFSPVTTPLLSFTISGGPMRSLPPSGDTALASRTPPTPGFPGTVLSLFSVWSPLVISSHLVAWNTNQMWTALSFISPAWTSPLTPVSCIQLPT